MAAFLPAARPFFSYPLSYSVIFVPLYYCMRKLLTITGILLVFLCLAQEKKLSALRIHSTVKIDGNLDEAVWKQAAVADSFIANLPRYGEPCSQRTMVHIIYDDQAVYIGAYLYDEPGLIRRQLTSRDGEQRKDVDFFSVFRSRRYCQSRTAHRHGFYHFFATDKNAVDGFGGFDFRYG